MDFNTRICIQSKQCGSVSNDIVPAFSPITYTVLVTNAAGCTSAPATTPSIFTSSLAFSPVPSSSPVLCNGGSTGSITALATGGDAPITYSILPVAGTYAGNGQFTSLPAGNYTVTATDNAGCSITTASITVSEPTIVSVWITNQSDPVCYNSNNGSITASGAGGTASFTYTISPNAGSESGGVFHIASSQYLYGYSNRRQQLFSSINNSYFNCTCCSNSNHFTDSCSLRRYKCYCNGNGWVQLF